jgi:TonB family protein
MLFHLGNLPRLPQLLSLTSMALRCLLFSSDEAMVQPIWEALAALGIEGEYCRSAVEAVERVTTQLFQIVITDWEDQPEAAFLLKTARDLKAAQRPLTLAIVSDDAARPAALQAGANSILLKPICAEQVREIMSTACELLKARLQAVTAKTSLPASSQKTQKTFGATAAVSAPASVTKMPEAFRAGEFLQSPGAAPGAQFDTESEVQKSLDHVVASEVDSLTDLEPTAAAVDTTGAETETKLPLTGWASLQARLTKQAPPPPPQNAPAKDELLSYSDSASYAPKPTKSFPENDSAPANEKPQERSELEAAPVDHTSAINLGENCAAPAKRSVLMPAGALVAVLLVVLAIPRTRQSLMIVARNIGQAVSALLNPPPAPLPQRAAQHDSFGQAGDEYSLPTAGNIPDATTDPSQIRVLPVVDPTAKPEKGAATNPAQQAAPTPENGPANPIAAAQIPNAQPISNDVKDQTPLVAPGASGNAAATGTSSIPASNSAPVLTPIRATPQLLSAAATQTLSRPVPVSMAGSVGIPSSLKSQIASMTPEASGTKPVEAAMSSFEPVDLPEAVVRGLLAQGADPAYPVAAKAGGQRGSVVLQILIARDGTVQDAKFMEGSLIFARAAIDAVKQWTFKPYLMNGRAVSVQSAITLNFKPPAVATP